MSGKKTKSKKAGANEPTSSGGDRTAELSYSTTLAADSPVDTAADSPVVDDTVANEQASMPSESGAAATVATRKPARWPLLLTAVIAVCAVTASGLLWLQQQQASQAQQSLAAEVSSALLQLGQQSEHSRELQRQLDQQMDRSAAALSTASDQRAQLQLQLRSQHQRLLSLSTTDRADWLLAEAEYLMKLANQRLLMGKEIAGAAELLQAADEIIHGLDDDAGLHSVRKALAADIAALKSADKFDLEGLYLKLGALAHQTGNLRLFEMPEFSGIESAPIVADNWQGRLKGGVAAALEKLDSYIDFKRHQTIYQPVLAPEYEGAVRQNVNLMFEQAQMALLAGKQQLYVGSLEKAQHWLENYYSLDEKKSRVIIAEIELLKAESVVVTLPNIGASARALRDYMDTVHRLPKERRLQSPSTDVAAESTEDAS